MSEFTIRSESVDVEQIMKQIRQRILEKRGADYTEEQIRELASVRLEKFLEPKNLRSDLLDQFRKSRPAVTTEPPKIEAPYAFDDQTLFASHRGPLRFMRKLLQPILKLFFNPNVLNQILHTQAQFNVDLLKRESRRKIEFDRSRAEWNALYYEVLHNSAGNHAHGHRSANLRMKLESISAGSTSASAASAPRAWSMPTRGVRVRTARQRDGEQAPVHGPAADRSKDSCPAAASHQGQDRRQRPASPQTSTGTAGQGEQVLGCAGVPGCAGCTRCAECTGCFRSGRSG